LQSNCNVTSETYSTSKKIKTDAKIKNFSRGAQIGLGTHLSLYLNKRIF